MTCCGWCGRYYDPRDVAENWRHIHHRVPRKSGLYGVILFNGAYTTLGWSEEAWNG